MDALSLRSEVNAIFIAYNHDLVCMIVRYKDDEYFAQFLNDLAQDILRELYLASDGFLSHNNQLYVVRKLRDKALSNLFFPQTLYIAIFNLQCQL